MRRLLELPALLRIALKLALLAASLPLIYHGMRYSNPLTGGAGGLLFAALWFYHGLTSGFDAGSVPEVHDSNPASGQSIIPGTRGLSSGGSYTGTRE